MKINHARRSLFLAETTSKSKWTHEQIWFLRLQEQKIHESHGDESQLYFTQIKTLLMHFRQHTFSPYVGYAQFHLKKNTPSCTVVTKDIHTSKKPIFASADQETNFHLLRLAGVEVSSNLKKLNKKANNACRTCGSLDIATMGLQIRSADESETVFCICRSCAKNGVHTRWVYKNV